MGVASATLGRRTLSPKKETIAPEPTAFAHDRTDAKSLPTPAPPLSVQLPLDADSFDRRSWFFLVTRSRRAP